MIEQIRRCQKCGLCFNQKPLLDVEKECQVFWVGLSAKKKKSNKEIPLSPETNTGMVIQRIEEVCGEVTTYKTNLVKCLPLTEEQKLRYPNTYTPSLFVKNFILPKEREEGIAVEN